MKEGRKQSKPGYMHAWEYLVRPDRVVEFERIYGPSGDWVELFRRAPGYIRTELHRDRAEPLRFMTMDYWDSKESWERFRAASAEAFEALDARCAQLTRLEKEHGRFEPVE